MSDWQACTKQPTVSCFSMTAMGPSGKETAAGSDNLYLPSEIIAEILKRLPVKSLLRFQCVCKDWRNLLKSQSFIAEHHHHSAHENHLVICHLFDPSYRNMRLRFLRYDKETMESERLPKNMDHSIRRFTDLIGSSNGMLCVKLGHRKLDPPLSLLVLNPATTEVRPVPEWTNDDGRSSSYFAFGYSPVVRDYKIVRFHHSSYNKPVDQVEVYSLKTRSWKLVEFGVIKGVSYPLYSHVAVNGAIFWLGMIEGAINHTVIISFDLATEVFTRIPLPSSASAATATDAATARLPTHALAVHENKLTFTQRRWHAYGPIIVKLWVLEEGKSSGADGNGWRWSKKYILKPDIRTLRPISLWRNRIICHDNMNKEVWFSVGAKNELYKFQKLLLGVDVHRMFFYAESLASINDMYLE